jgi:hypothetical protein
MAGYGGPIDAAVIHIRSEHKWPQRLQFDTAAPAVLPPSPPVVAAMAEAPKPAEDPKLGARAELRAPEKQAVAKPRPRVAARRRYVVPSEGTRLAVNPWPASW